MGCITSNDVKNPKNHKSKKQNQKQIQPPLYKSKLQKSNMSRTISPRNQQIPHGQKLQKSQNPLLPKIKKTTSIQFLSQYEITSTLIESTRLQGPKLITNKISGAVNVLRVYNPQKIIQQRLKKYHQILKFQLYTDQEENYLVIDQYCSGHSICQLFSQLTVEEQKQLNSEQRKLRQMQIYKTLLQVHDIITQFHTNKMFLGNLSLFSFKKVSHYDDNAKLVQFNLEQHQPNEHNSMGHAHNNSYQSDWQFYGYLLQFYLSSKSPIFISHKMQYIQNQSSLSYSSLISSLLKGRQIHRKQIEQIDHDKFIIKNQNVLNGYRFCRDVLRLVKARKRRMKHKASYYSQSIFAYYQSRNQKESQNAQDEEIWKLNSFYNSSQEQSILTEQNLHRLETERILSEIQKYIQNLNPYCEEHFINYSMAAQSFRKLKQVFLITDRKQKVDEFRELIPQIK